MVVFTIGAGTGLPTGINNNTTYTATAVGTPIPANDDANTYSIELRDLIANGTSDIITPVQSLGATNVELQAYHAQFNEEFILDPLDTIDSVVEMTAAQKTELRNAARINFRNRVVFTRVVTATGGNIPDIDSFPGSGVNVIVRIRASGVSGVTRLILNINNSLATSIVNVDDLADLNTGDDIEFDIDVSLTTSYTADAELTIALEGTSALDIETATLGDLLGAGVTVEDADLVVTPSRVESAIHNMDLNAIADVRDAINSPDTFLELTDTPDAFGTTGQVLQVNGDRDGLVFGAGGDTSSLATAGYTYTTDTTAEGERTLVLTRDSNDVVYGTYIERADGTVDFMVSGQFIAGGG